MPLDLPATKGLQPTNKGNQDILIYYCALLQLLFDLLLS